MLDYGLSLCHLKFQAYVCSKLHYICEIFYDYVSMYVKVYTYCMCVCLCRPVITRLLPLPY